MPSFDSRLAAAKMFLELNQTDTVPDIVEVLVMEAEDDPELYFLLGVSSEDLDERMSMLKMSLDKIAKAEKEGQTDLEHLKKAVTNAIKNCG